MKNFLISSKKATPKQVAEQDILREKHKDHRIILDLKKALEFEDDLVTLQELSF